MLDKTTGLIDFDNDAVKIECLVRGLNPWPSAYTFFRGKRLNVWEATVEKTVDAEKQAFPWCGRARTFD